MSDHDPIPGEPTLYSLLLRERAIRDINAAYVRFAEIVSESVANEWRSGLMEAIKGLAMYPRRFPRVPEPFRKEVRQLLYRRSGSQVAYRVLFTITGEETLSPESPAVIILHVRHAVQTELSDPRFAALRHPNRLHSWDNVGPHRKKNARGLWLKGQAGRITALAFSTDSQTVVTGSEDGTLMIWSAASGELLATLQALPEEQWVIFTPDGRYSASPGASEYVRWRLGTNVYQLDQFCEEWRRLERV